MTNGVLHNLRTAFLARDSGHLTDGQLLDSYVGRHEQAAFEALVRRHGPMVLGVCRRVLHHAQDAEDAFQATFLLLVHKAAAVQPREQVGNWLYGVAYRTALKARGLAARQRARQKPLCDNTCQRPEMDDAECDLKPLLDREVNRLPEKLRLPLVLCELEGRPRREVADLLGLAEGTLSSRLARARARLRHRLARYGPALLAGTLASLLPHQAAAGVPQPLLAQTIRAAAQHASGATTVGSVSAGAAALTRAMLRTMAANRLSFLAALVAALGFLAAAAGLLAHAVPSGKPSLPARPGQTRLTPRPTTPTAGNEHRLKMVGTWVSLNGAHQRDRIEELQDFKVVITRGSITFNPDKDKQVYTYRLDSRRGPHRIDLTAVNGPHKGKTIPGIYALDGDYLEICFDGWKGERRPRAFVTTKGLGGQFLLVLKRQTAGENTPYELSRLNLKRIALAMYAYHNTNDRFPPAAGFSKDGKPLYSWRVLLLPYLYQDNLFKFFRLNEAWDSPNNGLVTQTVIKTFAAPLKKAGANLDTTYYQVLTGKGTAFEGQKGLRLRDFTDGPSHSILVVEADKAVPWTKPEGLVYAAAKPVPKLGGLFKVGFHVLLADGSVRFVKQKVNEKILRRAITRNDGQAFAWEDLNR
jgi:RNA polymerase sigma factor (sigma-70 family)